VLAECFAELPLQVQRPQTGSDGQAIVTLLTPGGSLLDGDAVELTVEVRPGAHAVLRQASATQLHGGESSGITFEANVHVAAGARFSYEPYELIPFAGSSYRQTLRLSLEQGAEARLLEVVTPGRSRERFRYQRLELRTDVFLAGRRILLDAQRIVPAHTDPCPLLGGFSHFGTLLHFGADVGACDADRWHARFAELGVCGSASTLPCYGVGARVLGSSAQQLLEVLSPCVL
jgi:urease accessory protein